MDGREVMLWPGPRFSYADERRCIVSSLPDQLTVDFPSLQHAEVGKG